jgi:hypothetical protein
MSLGNTAFCAHALYARRACSMKPRARPSMVAR